MFSLLVWAFFGLLVGIISKMIHPGDEPVGFAPTVVIGVVGSFIGGSLNYLLGSGGSMLAPSGFVMSIVGGVIFCIIWRWYKLHNSSSGPKSFLTGRSLK